MISLKEALTPDRIVIDCRIHSKKRTLELLSKLLTEQADLMPHQPILTALLEREKLGSTAMGHGVAIPHARIPDLLHPIIAMIRLHEPIAFDDDAQVDLIFGIIVPENEDQLHLDLLQAIATRLQDEATRQTIRSLNDIPALYDFLTA
jgi:nitrogen PTS system EIIA component